MLGPIQLVIWYYSQEFKLSYPIYFFISNVDSFTIAYVNLYFIKYLICSFTSI